VANAEFYRQICVKALDGDDLDFVQVTKEGSNMLPDWHAE